MAIRIILAEDHTIVREGLCALIEKQSDMEVIGEAGNGREVIQLVEESEPDVVIMDVSMPEMNGIEATRWITSNMNNVKVLALSVHDKRAYVMDMLKAGVSGYLLKDCVSSELVQAIRRVAANESYLSPKITAIVIDNYIAKHSPALGRPAGAVLKGDELEVLKLLAEGKSAREIAEQYGVNVKTIEAKRRRIINKLGINSFADLVKYAIREGLTTC